VPFGHHGRNRRCNNWLQTALTLAAGTQEARLTVAENIAAVDVALTVEELRRIEELVPGRHSQGLALHGGDHEVGQQLILPHVDAYVFNPIVSGLCYLQ
jgi:hypothetical protein